MKAMSIVVLLMVIGVRGESGVASAQEAEGRSRSVAPEHVPDHQAILRLFESGALEEAQAAVEAALDHHDDDPRLQFLAARIYSARADEMTDGLAPGGRFARMLRLDALSAAERASALGLASPDLFVLRTRLLRQENRLDEAVHAAEQSPALDSDRDLLYELALVRSAQKKPAEAARLAARCRQLDPHDVDAGILEVSAREQAAQRGRSLDVLTRLARDNPGRLDIAARLWPLHGGVADFKSAIIDYETLAETLPEEAWYRFYLGATRRRAGDLEGAQRDLRHALELRPDLLEATAELGLVETQQGRLDEAARHLIEVVRVEGPLRERSIEVLLSVGAGLARRFSFDRALTCYDAVLAADESNYYARLDRALLLRQMGRTEGAAAAYAAIETLYPGDGNVLNDHALVYLGCGRDEEARDLFEKAAAAGSIDAEENLAMLAWAGGDVTGCLGHLREVLRREPDRTKARYTLEMARREMARQPATPR